MYRFLIPIESAAGETRVAATPETVKKFISLGCKVTIEKDAGLLAGFKDEDYLTLGAEITSQGDASTWSNSDCLLCVQTPKTELLAKLKPESLIVGLLAPYENSSLKNSIKSRDLSAIALELLPRISRAQSADALSSQANIAGYKSVLIAAASLDRYFPMLMTAAGTVQPARVVVLGAGVAGLQAVATAKRLGAVVYVSDIRPAVKEQVESLGAKFIEPPEIESKSSEIGGYAKESSEQFLTAQREKLSQHLSEADVAICTAQVPGKKAPRLIDEEILDRMRPGSVVIDLAVAQGGNCANTMQGQTVQRKGVKLIGASNLPCTIPNHASALYARNLLALLEPMIDEGHLKLNVDDELINGSLISQKGSISARHENLISPGGEN